MKLQEWFTDESKWSQGADFRDSAGSPLLTKSGVSATCLMGAILICTTDEDKRGQLIDMICATIGNITVWNDNPERTFEDIVSLVTKLNI